MLASAPNLRSLTIKVFQGIRVPSSRSQEFGAGTGAHLAAIFFMGCYVWVEQMSGYRNDGKSWMDVLTLARGGSFEYFDDVGMYFIEVSARYSTKYRKAEFCSHIQKLLKE